jgi:hypothetical protein
VSGPGPAGVHARREQAAAQAVEYELCLLRAAHRDEFIFGHDPERGYWVIRDGSIGSLLTAPTPGELGRKIRDTWGVAPS